MPYCPNCGTQTDKGMYFCPNCGNALSSSTTTVQNAASAPVYQQPPTTYNYNNVTTAIDYSLVLVSLGTSTKSSAQSLIRDILGYTLADANRITAAVPTELACALNFRQALDLARVFTEYGMQVAVYNSGGYVNFAPYAESSAFNSSGSLLDSVLATLSTLTVANRVTSFIKRNLTHALQNLFRPKYHYEAPPKYERRYTPVKKVPSAQVHHKPAHANPATHSKPVQPKPSTQNHQPLLNSDRSHGGPGSHNRGKQ